MESNNLLGWSDTDQIKRDYFEVCEEIISDENLFSNFKQNPKYTPILEHVDYDLGWKYFNIICSDYGNYLLKKIIDLIPAFKRNDLYGNPLKYNYPIFGDISPTTLRYIKTLMDIISRGVDLNGKDIVEIGGGYGGQALILYSFFPAIKSYTILDLESAAKLQTKYMALHPVTNFVATSLDVFEERQYGYDFVMSNYAFSELKKEMQDQYLEKIIRNSAYGYFQINPDASQCYNREELIAILMTLNSDTLVLPDKPMNEWYPNNFIFSF